MLVINLTKFVSIGVKTMTRKLVSVLLSAFALLLLMGASAPLEQPDTLPAEEESAVFLSAALETEAYVHLEEAVEGAVQATASANPLEVAESTDNKLLIDGVPAPIEVGRAQKDGVTYVALAPMAQALNPSAQVAWDGSTATVTTPALRLTAKVGQLYLEANGRYLYLPEGVQLSGGRVIVPLWAVAEAFGATVGWNAATGTVTVTRGSGAIQPGDSYYNQEDLFWLSRVIYAESGNQSLEGKMAVGNVVLNRVANPIYPNTIQGVLAQKNQFSTYKSGALAYRTPTESCIIAAKLVLDGGVVEETEGALYFDSARNSWASRNRTYVTTLGGHKFYR